VRHAQDDQKFRQRTPHAGRGRRRRDPALPKPQRRVPLGRPTVARATGDSGRQLAVPFSRRFARSPWRLDLTDAPLGPTRARPRAIPRALRRRSLPALPLGESDRAVGRTKLRPPRRVRVPLDRARSNRSSGRARPRNPPSADRQLVGRPKRRRSLEWRPRQGHSPGRPRPGRRSRFRALRLHVDREWEGHDTRGAAGVHDLEHGRRFLAGMDDATSAVLHADVHRIATVQQRQLTELK
jgi:hypothetical protein